MSQKPLLDKDGNPVTIFGLPVYLDSRMAPEQVELAKLPVLAVGDPKKYVRAVIEVSFPAPRDGM